MFADNGDDNLILGLCVHQASGHDKFRVQVGNEEWRELSPQFVLMCLTLEGKLVLYNVARFVFLFSALAIAFFDINNTFLFSSCSLDGTGSPASEEEEEESVDSEVSFESGKEHSEKGEGSDNDVSAHKEGAIAKPSYEDDAKQQLLYPTFSAPLNVEQKSTRDTAGAQMFTGFGSGASSVPPESASLNFGSTSFLNASSKSLPRSQFVPSKATEVKSPIIPSTYNQRDDSETIRPNATTSGAGQKETVGTSRPSTSIIESLPSVRTTQEISRTLPQSGMLISEPNLSKQFGNVISLCLPHFILFFLLFMFT